MSSILCWRVLLRHLGWLNHSVLNLSPDSLIMVKIQVMSEGNRIAIFLLVGNLFLSQGVCNFVKTYDELVEEACLCFFSHVVVSHHLDRVLLEFLCLL